MGLEAPKSTDALMTGGRNQSRVSRPMRPPWGQPHLHTLSPEAPGGPEVTLGSRGPSCPLVPRLSCGRDEHVEGTPHRATGAPRARIGHGVLDTSHHCSLTPPQAWYLLSSSQVPHPPVGGMASEKNSPTRGRGVGEDGKDIQGQWGKWESVEGMCGANQGQAGEMREDQTESALTNRPGAPGGP